MWRIVYKSSANQRQDAFWGGRGGPRICFLIGFLLFLGFKSPCKNLKSYDNPFWVKKQGGWEEEEGGQEENNSKKSGHLVCAISQGQRTHSTWTNFLLECCIIFLLVYTISINEERRWHDVTIHDLFSDAVLHFRQCKNMKNNEGYPNHPMFPWLIVSQTLNKNYNSTKFEWW